LIEWHPIPTSRDRTPGYRIGQGQSGDIQGGLHKHACGGASEELAYAAQDQWLKLFGRDLLSEFQIDAFTIKVMTACFF
jgi:hypothetical protein